MLSSSIDTPGDILPPSRLSLLLAKVNSKKCRHQPGMTCRGTCDVKAWFRFRRWFWDESRNFWGESNLRGRARSRCSQLQKGCVSPDKILPLIWSKADYVRWQTELPGPGNSSPIVWGERVFVAQSAEKESRRTLMCFDRASGNLV
jgi:hypothetical protein